MKKEKEINNLFDVVDLNNSSINNSSINNPPLSSSFLKENPRNIKQILNDNNSSKNDDLLPVLNMLNEQSSPKEYKPNNLNNIYNNLKERQSIINNEIMENLKSIEKLKNSLAKLKSEKNDKKLEVVNFLSNKESLDEIYNNYMDYLKNKKREIKGKNKKYKYSKPNPFENQDEDTFEILISEIKEIDVNKFIEQTFNFVEEIFDNPSQQMKLSLKDIIDKSYTQFNKEISSSQFLDTYSIVSNFFLRISIFLSNESNGKYSETIINLFLRCLLKMNSINVKNEELINYMNTKYKEEKEKLKEEIFLLNQKNEILNKDKILLQNQIKDIDGQIHIEKNEENFNINNIEQEGNNIFLQKDLNESNKKININNGINQPKNKRNGIKEKFKLINKFQKVYKEDIIENNLNCNEVSVNYDKSIIIKENKKVINENDIRNYNKILYENFNKINSNSKYISNKYINETKNKNIFNLNNKNSNINHSNKIFNSVTKKEEEYEKKEIPIPFIKKIENTNIKKYNTINYHEMSKINNFNPQKEYISPEFDNKKISYYKEKEKEKNKSIKEKSYKKKSELKEKEKENNINQKLMQRIYYNKNVKGVMPQKKKLNYHYISKNINNNNIISLSEINKNMKFDLVKKINYLEKVNTNFNLQLKNIPHNIKIFDDQNMRLLTEKKEKSFKYNFFDIFQETNNKKRNNSGDNNHKNVNNLNNSNHKNILLRSTNEKTQKTTHKIYDYIIKTDYINNKTKSYYENDTKFFNTFNNSNRKEIKNGIEIENPHNGSDSSNSQFEFSFPKKYKIAYDNRNKNKLKNFNEINKNKKELNIYNNKNIPLNDRNKCYHYNKNSDIYNNSGQKKDNSSNSKFSGCKCQSLRKERNINNILNKDIKKNNIYFIITESRNNLKKNKYLIKYKNENTIEKNSKSKSKRSNINKNRNYEKEYNSYSKSKKKISNFNNKFNNAILLKRSISSTLNKLINSNLPKKPTLDSNLENNIINNSYNNNSFVSNSLGVSVSNGKKKVKEIVSYNDKKKKTKIIKVPISNLKVGINNNSYNNNNNNSEQKIKYKLNYKEKFLNKNIVKDEYYNLIKNFKNQKETFCYFKIFEKDFKNKNKFNPLENCSINPENIGYCEGYVTIDNISNYIKIVSKKSSNTKYNNKNNFSGTELINNYSINTFLKKDKIKYGYNLPNKIKDSNLNIKLKEIYETEVTNTMNNIIKIHKIFLKYNSIQKNNINDIKDLNLNKFIYMREMQEINIPQNEKIKAILCNYFSFSFIFEKHKQFNEIELIFINFEQYNLWNSFIKSIVNINSKNNINKKDEFPERKSINNSIDYTHIKGSIINGSSINEDISKISSKDIINF